MKLLTKNIHIVERGGRIAAGLAGLALVFAGPQSLWGLVGLVPLVTGAMGSCPIYSVLGIGSCSVSAKKSA